MFTKCPSCHTEISFEPPANAPAGYKHRIKCPNPACGVTISVALPQKQAAAPASPAVAVGKPGVAPTDFTSVGPAIEANQTSGKVKYKLRTRNFFMLLFSLIFVALNVVAYLIATGKMAGIAAIGFGASELGDQFFVPFNGISFFEALIRDFQGVMNAFSDTNTLVIMLIMSIAPALLLLLAGILTISNFIGLIASKYGKTGNVIFSLLIFLLSAVVALQFYLVFTLAGWPVNFMDYIKAIFTEQLVSVIAVGVGLLFFIFSIIFAAKKKKAREPKIV